MYSLTLPLMKLFSMIFRNKYLILRALQKICVIAVATIIVTIVTTNMLYGAESCEILARIAKADETLKPKISSSDGIFKPRTYTFNRKDNLGSEYQTKVKFNPDRTTIVEFEVHKLFRKDSTTPYASDVLFADAGRAANKVKANKILVPEKISHINVINEPSKILVHQYLGVSPENTLIDRHGLHKGLFESLINTPGTNGITTQRYINAINTINGSNYQISAIEVEGGSASFNMTFHIHAYQQSGL